MDMTGPSGLAGTYRRLRVADERLLADRRLLVDGSYVQRIVETVWEKTTDPGPYPTDLKWIEVAQADLYAVFLKALYGTYGPAYRARRQCDGCRRMVDFRVYLDEVPQDAPAVDNTVVTCALTCRPMSRDMRTALQGRGAVDLTLADGRVLKFRPLLGRDLAAIYQVGRDDETRLREAAFCRRVVELAGETHASALRQALLVLDSAEAAAIQGQIDDHEGGYDTSLYARCPTCDAESEFLFPFDPSGFLRQAQQRSSRSRPGQTGWPNSST